MLKSRELEQLLIWGNKMLRLFCQCALLSHLSVSMNSHIFTYNSWHDQKCLWIHFLFCIRYAIIHQRTQRHELFTPAIMGTDSDDAGRKFKLQPIEFLLSSSGKVKEVIVLGLLTQLREGRYYLEDPTGILQLDLSEAISFIIQWVW